MVVNDPCVTTPKNSEIPHETLSWQVLRPLRPDQRRRTSPTVSSFSVGDCYTTPPKKKTKNKRMSPEKEAFYTNFILIIRIETSIFRGDMLTMLVFGSVFFPKNHERTFSLGSCGKIHVCLWQWARQQTILLACQNQGTTRDLLRVPGNPEMPWLWCISHIALNKFR